MIKHICVYCGSSLGDKKEYYDTAVRLGKTLAERSITLVYGGGKVGLMGLIAKTVMDAGGEVIGVIPRHLLQREVGADGISDLRVVDTMHERKALMADLSDGFIAMPGGLGTLEEITEVLTWSQLGLHQKPCGFLNICNYYRPLMAFFDTMVAEKFVDEAHRSMILVDDDPVALLDHFNTYHAPLADKAAWALKNSIQ